MKIPFLQKISVKAVETLKKSETKSEKQLIEEIHEDFMTEVDKLLAEAKITREVKTDKQNLINKADVLKKFGFDNAVPTLEAVEEKSRIRKIEVENYNKQALISAIEYFSQNYPYKFITEESVKRICEKYGLIYGDVTHYRGDVPDKNVKELQAFVIKNEDKCYMVKHQSRGWGEYSWDIVDFISYSRKLKQDDYACKHAPLEIAASPKDFNLDGMRIKDFKISSKPAPPDPILLQPVMHGSRKYYLIVTAWGPEASDSEVVNEKMN